MGNTCDCQGAGEYTPPTEQEKQEKQVSRDQERTARREQHQRNLLEVRKVLADNATLMESARRNQAREMHSVMAETAALLPKVAERNKLLLRTAVKADKLAVACKGLRESTAQLRSK
jgi:hypothetical protein